MRIGIDVGGTKIEGIFLDHAGKARAHYRRPTPRDDYDAILDAIREVVERLEAEVGARGTIGVATPGFLVPARGIIRNSNLGPLNDRPLDRDLSVRLGRPVRVANDANCFVLSEATDGAAASPAGLAGDQPDVVFGATLGTGVGGGLVVDGRVHGGANGAAGEWSHTTLPFWRDEDGPGGGCPCPHRSCIESFLSGRGLAWDYGRQTGLEVDGPEVARRAAAGDEAALATFARYEDRLARATAAVINLLDPRAIVLGGGISNNTRLFTNVPALWERYTVARDLATLLVPAQHGDASGVRGAAWLWPAAGTPVEPTPR